MKKIEVRRHAPKHPKGHLTDEGKKMAEKRRSSLIRYDLIISSNKPRAVETALLITGIAPKIDERAGTPKFTLEEETELHMQGEKHPFGIAGVINDNPRLREMVDKQGGLLVDLIKETFKKLPENGLALIISHDGVMVAADRKLKNISSIKAHKTFKPLMGFEVRDDGSVSDLA